MVGALLRSLPMKRYLFGMAILALAAAGVVWVAIKEQRAATAAGGPKKASAARALDVGVPASVQPHVDAAPTTPASATPDPAIGDAGPTTPDVATPDASTPDGQSVPPLAPYAAWSAVRWGMARAEVGASLKEAGFTVDDAAETTPAAQRLRAKSGPREVTIDFGASGPRQIVVTAASVSKEDAEAAVAKIKARAAATSTVERSERRWKLEGDAVVSLGTEVDGNKTTLREEHVRERAPGGAVGFAKLRWGMSTAEVVGYVTAAGYAAHVVKGNASDADTVTFTKADAEGTASFNQFGLRRIEIASPTGDGGAARAKELETLFGKAAATSVSTKTQHVDHGRMTAIEVEVKESQPSGGFTVIETYRPK